MVNIRVKRYIGVHGPPNMSIAKRYMSFAFDLYTVDLYPNSPVGGKRKRQNLTSAAAQ
jgi:hypothetical protein